MLPLRKLRVSRANARAGANNPKLPVDVREKARKAVAKLDRAIEARKVLILNDLKRAQTIMNSGES